MSLWQDFKSNKNRIVHKWVHYFPIYEKHLTQYKNQSLTIFEIGVFKGGSLQMWQRFFGPFVTIVGIDINPDCKKFEEPGIHVRIGDQSDPKFLQSLIDEFGVPDIVLDDGSHQMKHIIGSFEFLYPKVTKNGCYIVEDLHTAYWDEYGGGLNKRDTFINISKNYIDSLNACHSRNQVKEDFISNSTFCISFYPSVIVFEKGLIPVMNAFEIGVKE